MTRINYHLIKTIGFLLISGVLIACALFFHNYSLIIIRRINEPGWLAPVLFLIAYCLATIMLLPTMVLTLAGGAIFGPVFGALLNIFGATSGAACAFLISRHLIYEWVIQKKGKRLNQLIAGVNQRGWVLIAFLRIVPIIPFNLVNYGLGVTGIKFRLYILTTFIFLIPTEIIYTWFGYAGIDALSGSDQFYGKKGIVITGLAILFLCVIQLIRRKQKHQVIH